MAVVVMVTQLTKVMDIFSDILSKSRLEQRPIPGNFIPRPKPKNKKTDTLMKCKMRVVYPPQ